MSAQRDDLEGLVARQQAEISALRSQLSALRREQAGAANEHARLLDEAQALQAIAAQLASTRDTQALLAGIVERTMAIVGADGVGVWLLDQEANLLHIAASGGLSATFLRRRLPRPLRPGPSTTPTFDRLRRTRRPLFERNAPEAARRRSAELASALEEEGIVSSLVLPLFEPGGAVIGMVILDHRCERLYTRDEIRVAQAFADQIAVALRNTRLADRERRAREEATRLADEERRARTAAARQLERLTALTGITQQLLAAGELETVLDVVVRSASRLCGADGAMVALIDPEQGTIRRAAGYGALRRMFGRSTFGRPLDEAFLAATATGRAIAEGRAIAVEDYASWGASPEWREATVAAGIGSLLAAPLRVERAVIGVLCVGDHTPRAFAPDDVGLVQALADQAALAIEQARLLARSRDAAALEERARLARDLHDSVTQSVFSAGMLAHTARLQHERGTATVGETLARVQTVLGDALSEMRALLYELQPTALADEGLAKALEKLARSMQVRTDAAVRYEGAPVPRLAPETETAIFRIVQEALGNAVKYARATTIRLTLTADGARLIAAVADDGVGFDQTVPVTPSADGRRGGMGLRAMRERAAAAGLRVTVASEPGHGARVTVEAPLVPPASASA